MGIPSPTVPASISDLQIPHTSTYFNPITQNLTNLWTAVNAGFTTQRPMAIAQQTTGQSITGSTDTLISFNSASVNTNNMWTASQPTQITIQIAGIYWVFGQVRWPTIGGATFPANWAQANLMANGTVPTTNTIAMSVCPFTTSGSGASNQVGTIVNLAANATLYLDVFGVYGGSATLQTNFGGTFLGAVWLSPST